MRAASVGGFFMPPAWGQHAVIVRASRLAEQKSSAHLDAKLYPCVSSQLPKATFTATYGWLFYD
jgi:hypothetical protein